MGIYDLYGELDVDFEPAKRPDFLQELSDVARDYKSHLGSEAHDEGEPSTLVNFVEELGKEVAELSPKLVPIPLNEKMFEELDLVIPSYIANLLNRFNFYLVDFPITLLPRPGWEFQRLECRVAFNPSLPNAERPIAYQIFPEEEWQDVAHLWQGLEVGLDEKLMFRIDDKALQSPLLQNIKSEERFAIEQKMVGKAGFILGPYNYYYKKPLVRSQGRGNVKVVWRLEGEEQITYSEPRLGVVLQVPKDVSKVDVIGAMVVSRKFRFIHAELRDVMDFLSEPTINFLKKGAPIPDKKSWDDITTGI